MLLALYIVAVLSGLCFLLYLFLRGRSVTVWLGGKPTQRWRCRRCGEDVDFDAFRCGCESGPSPWEPVEDEGVKS